MTDDNIKKAFAERPWILTIAVLLSALVFFINFGAKGPMIQADEGSYLSTAAAIAGFYNDMAGSYHAGYPMLISPVFLLGDSPSEIWILVKVANTILFFSIVILLWMIAKRWVPDISPGTRISAVVLVSIYPMWVIMAGYAFAQIAFVPAFLLMVLFFFEAVSGRVLAWPVLGGVSGILYWMHPTAVVALIAVCISLLYVTWRLHCYKRFIVFFSVLLCVVLAYHIGIVPWILNRMSTSGQSPCFHYPTVLKALSAISSLNGIKRTLSVFGGHVFYISLGTLGFVVSGFITLAGRVFNSAKDEAAATKEFLWKANGLFLLLAIIGSVSLSAIALSDAERLDHWMYGRYVEGYIAPVLLVGVLAGSWRKVLWAIPVAVIGAALLFPGLHSYAHTAPFNVPTFWQEFFIRDKGLFVWLLAGAAIVAFVGLLPRQISYFIAIGYFCFCSYFQADYHHGASEYAVDRWIVAQKVRDLYPPGTCVGFDQTGLDSFERTTFWYDFGFVLFDYGPRRMSFEEWISSCNGPFFSYVKDLDKLNSGIYPAAISMQGGPTLWVKGRPPVSEPYPMSVSNRSVPLLRTLGEGWYDLERSGVWSTGMGELNLPIPDHCRSLACSADLKLSAYGASSARPVKLFILDQVDNELIDSVLFSNSDFKMVCVPLCGKDTVRRIFLSVPDAISPMDLYGEKDTRILGVNLSEITLSEWLAGRRIINFKGPSLLNLPRQVGRVESLSIISDGRPGFLVFGPYEAVDAGWYKFVLRGKSGKSDVAWVDVVSGKGTIQYGKFALRTTQGDDAVLAEGQIKLAAPVGDIEVRVYVGSGDEVTLDGYELVPLESEDHLSASGPKECD